MIMTEKKRRRNKQEITTIVMEPVEVSSKTIISEDLINSLIRNNNTVISYETYHRLLNHIWNDVLLNDENIFDCSDETALMKRTFMCHEKIKDIFKERTGFDVNLRYVYNAYGLQSVEKAQLGSINKSAYFVVEKVSKRKTADIINIPEVRTYMAYQEGKNTAARQMAAVIKRDCQVKYGGKLTIQLDTDTVEIVESPEDLANYILRTFGL